MTHMAKPVLAASPAEAPVCMEPSRATLWMALPPGWARPVRWVTALPAALLAAMVICGTAPTSAMRAALSMVTAACLASAI
ncbi:MAG: hypothetical protein ACLU98_01650 [Desulfovibrio fairfieldensis]